MTQNQTYQTYTIDTASSDGEKLTIRHNPSGEEHVFNKGEYHTPALNTDGLFTESRGPSVTVHNDGGTIVADGPDSELASGDFTTPGDVTSVLQVAIDHGGEVSVKPADYTLGVGGTDAEGTQYCLSIASGTRFEVQKGATLHYPAENTTSGSGTPDVASPILASGVDDWQIVIDGVVDCGCQGDTQNSTQVNAMGVKIGCRGETGTGCKNWSVRGDGEINGAYRHGVEAIQPRTENGRISVSRFIDPGGDDAVSISGGATNVIAHGVTSIKKRRDGGWGPGNFEVEDGAKNSGFIDCYAVNSSTGDGFVLGKQHSDWNNTQGFAYNCHVINSSGGAAFVLGQSIGTNSPRNVVLDGFSVRGCPDMFGVAFRPSNNDIESPVVRNGIIQDTDGGALFCPSSADGNVNHAKIESVYFYNCGHDSSLPLFNFSSRFKSPTITDCVAESCYQGPTLRTDGLTLHNWVSRGSSDRGPLIKATHAHLSGLHIKNATGHGLKLDSATNVVIDNCLIYDDQSTPTMTHPLSMNPATNVHVSNCILGPTDGSGVQDSATDSRFINCRVPGGFPDWTDPTRRVVNGWGTNSGDPNSTGQWNGNGEEGISVYDTANGVKYTHINGSWV